jgi:hypothetical protein
MILNGLGGQDLRVLGRGKSGREPWWSQTRVSAPYEQHRGDARASGAVLCEFGKLPKFATTKEEFVRMYDLPSEVSDRLTDLTAQSGHCELRMVAGEVVDSFELLNINEMDAALTPTKMVAPDRPDIVAPSTDDVVSTLAYKMLLSRLRGRHGPSTVTADADAAALQQAAHRQSEGQWTSMQLGSGWRCAGVSIFAAVIGAGRAYGAMNRTKHL